MPDGAAIFEALSLGLIIPTIAAVVPASKAFQKSLVDSLNTVRQTGGVKITISSEKVADLTPMIAFGVISVLFGVSIYYFLPLSLLSMNASMLLTIFFFILIGMVFSLLNILFVAISTLLIYSLLLIAVEKKTF